MATDSIGIRLCLILGLDPKQVTEIVFRQTSAMKGQITVTLIPDKETGEKVSRIFEAASWREAAVLEEAGINNG